MSGMDYKAAQRIRFRRSVMRPDPRIDHQINTAICTLCGDESWTEGRNGITGIGELNRAVAKHRHMHHMHGEKL